MAYGARLESVLGASPRGFESPILRQTRPQPTGCKHSAHSRGSNPPFSAKPSPVSAPVCHPRRALFSRAVNKPTRRWLGAQSAMPRTGSVGVLEGNSRNPRRS